MYKPEHEHFPEAEADHMKTRPQGRSFADPVEHVPLIEQTLALAEACREVGIGFTWYRTWTPAMDDILHAERLDGKAKRTHRRALDSLPDGAMIALDGAPYAVRGDRLLPWTPSGYGRARPRPRGIDTDVLTPPSILAVLARGYRPLWHESAA